MDSHPYTGSRSCHGKVRAKTAEEASWLNSHFDGSPNYEQITTITRGKEYDVIAKEGYGDVEDIIIINDNGIKQSFGDFLFVNVE